MNNLLIIGVVFLSLMTVSCKKYRKKYNCSCAYISTGNRFNTFPFGDVTKKEAEDSCEKYGNDNEYKDCEVIE